MLIRNYFEVQGLLAEAFSYGLGVYYSPRIYRKLIFPLTSQ